METCKGFRLIHITTDILCLLSEVDHVFACIDKDGNGCVDRGELMDLLRQMGRDPTDAEIDNYFKQLDTDSKFHITY